jgi:hypothetical protein
VEDRNQLGSGIPPKVSPLLSYRVFQLKSFSCRACQRSTETDRRFNIEPLSPPDSTTGDVALCASAQIVESAGVHGARCSSRLHRQSSLASLKPIRKALLDRDARTARGSLDCLAHRGSRLVRISAASGGRPADDSGRAAGARSCPGGRVGSYLLLSAGVDCGLRAARRPDSPAVAQLHPALPRLADCLYGRGVQGATHATATGSPDRSALADQSSLQQQRAGAAVGGGTRQ